MSDQREPVVTTGMFTEPEQAAWRVAVDRGLPIEAADLRRLLEAAAPRIAAAERERIRQPLREVIDWAGCQPMSRVPLHVGEALVQLHEFAGQLLEPAP